MSKKAQVDIENSADESIIDDNKIGLMGFNRLNFWDLVILNIDLITF